ncbi:MAG: MFS transporter [Elusimicrobiales bacterium]
MLSKFKEGLSKNVVVLGIVSGLTDISSEMLYPVIPIFLNSVLNAPMSIIGLVEGIAEATASILKIYGGYLSDKFKKRKSFVVLGYSLSSVSKPLMAVASSWYLVLFARFIDRVGKGIRTSPRDALIASSVSKQHWGKAFGFHRAMDTLGAAIGPLITLLLIWKLGETPSSYRYIFTISFIPALAGVFILIKYISEKNNNDANLEINKRISLFSFSKDFKIFITISTIFFLFKFSDAFFIMKAKKTGFSTSGVIWVYFFYNILYTILSTPAGVLADRLGKAKLFTSGFLVFAIVCVMFSIANTKETITAAFAVYSLYGALNEGIAKAVISSLTQEENRATAMGVYHSLTGISLLFSSIIAGLLWDRFSPSTPFLISAVISAAITLTSLIWIKIRRIYI